MAAEYDAARARQESVPSVTGRENVVVRRPRGAVAAERAFGVGHLGRQRQQPLQILVVKALSGPFESTISNWIEPSLDFDVSERPVVVPCDD